MKTIFDTRPDTAYDDDLVRRYHFPNRYLSDAWKYVGDWIVYREPRRLMDKHELADWTLAFTEFGRRLGDCNSRDRVTRIGRAYALEDGDERIRDTMLHGSSAPRRAMDRYGRPLRGVSARRWRPGTTKPERVEMGLRSIQATVFRSRGAGFRAGRHGSMIARADVVPPLRPSAASRCRGLLGLRFVARPAARGAS